MTSRRPRKVGAFIVGAPRCGTTAWFSYLRQHPQIAGSQRKEPNRFCTDLPRLPNVRDEAKYHALFNWDRQIALEASVIYLYSQTAPRLIRDYNPDAKIIIFLRPPLEFLRSYHSLLRWLLFEDEPDLAKAWALQAQRREGLRLPRHCLEPPTLQYAAVAKFGEQLARYLDHFPVAQVRVVPYESWVGAPRPFYQALLRFLDVDDDGRESFPIVHAAQTYRSYALAPLLRYPPHWLWPVKGIWRRIPGTDRINLNKRLNRWNTRPLSAKPIDGALSQQVLTALEEDQVLLRQLLPKVRISVDSA